MHGIDVLKHFFHLHHSNLHDSNCEQLGLVTYCCSESLTYCKTDVSTNTCCQNVKKSL